MSTSNPFGLKHEATILGIYPMVISNTSTTIMFDHTLIKCD